jgi:hypothetical protein
MNTNQLHQRKLRRRIRANLRATHNQQPQYSFAGAGDLVLNTVDIWSFPGADGLVTNVQRGLRDYNGNPMYIRNGALVLDVAGHGGHGLVSNVHASDPLAMPVPVLNMQAVSIANRQTYHDLASLRRNRTAEGSHADVLDSLGSGSVASWEQRDPGGVGAQPTYGTAPRTLSPEEFINEAMSDDEVSRENRRRQGLDVGDDQEFSNSSFTDLFARNPAFGVSSREWADQFLSSQPATDRQAGQRGYSRTTSWGSGPRDWETSGPSQNQLLATMPNNQMTQNIKRASLPPGPGGMPASADGALPEEEVLGIPRLDYKAIAAENRKR